jgi:hypothetical protein
MPQFIGMADEDRRQIEGVQLTPNLTLDIRGQDREYPNLVMILCHVASQTSFT